MAYLNNTQIPMNLLFTRGLRLIYGVGSFYSQKVRSQIGLGKDLRTQDLSPVQWSELQAWCKHKFLLSDMELKRSQRKRIETLILMKSYRGIRHKSNLPVRGQRSHTNARTQKRKKPGRSR